MLWNITLYGHIKGQYSFQNKHIFIRRSYTVVIQLLVADKTGTIVQCSPFKHERRGKNTTVISVGLLCTLYDCDVMQATGADK